MAILSRNSAFSRVTALAEQRPLHEAFRWLHLHGQQMMRWQEEVVRIPAPPFGEALRSAWMAEQFRSAGLEDVETDAVGNVFGIIAPADPGPAAHGPVVVLSAHLDTVFPAGTPLEPVVDHDRIEAPGACDNASGIIGMLAIAHALIDSNMRLGATLVFCGNVGEEGEGDLRGVRHLYQQSRYAGRVAAHIVLDGAGAVTAVTQALGSWRYRVTMTGPGGHSFTDAGTPNPIAALASALAAIAETPLPAEPRTTLNLGTIHGGTSVNSIPEIASASIDCRSIAPEQLVRLEVAVHRAVEDAVERANEIARGNGVAANKLLSFAIHMIGDRPAAQLPADSPLLEALRAVDRHMGIRSDLRLGSTDANIPMAQGVPALSMGAGGDGGGAHTRQEWYSDKNRETGLKRVLLLTLAMAEWAAGL